MSREAFEVNRTGGGEHSITSGNILTEVETGRVVAVFYNDYDLEALTAQLSEIDQLRTELAKAQVVPEYPMQPMQNKRFEANPIIEHFIEDLNAVAVWCQLNDIDGKYQEQLAQLIGYSLSGYGELSYVSDESYDRAVKSLQGETV